MSDTNQRFAHLKDLTGDDSPIILAACITGHDYTDAIRILKGQGYKVPRDFHPWDDKRVNAIDTGLTDKSTIEVENLAYTEIGEYLACAGGEKAMPDTLDRIFKSVVELIKRR